MGDVLSQFVEWLEDLPLFWAYGTLFLVAYGENIIPPIPGDMVVVFGGYLAGRGELSLWMVMTLAIIGGTLGFMSVYLVGRSLGDAVHDPDRFTWLPKKQIGKAEDWLRKHGYGVVAANRFLSGLRSVIALAVGMVRMAPWETALWATFSATAWVALITYAGYAVGENWQIVSGYLRSYGYIVLGVLGLIVIIRVARIVWKKRTAR